MATVQGVIGKRYWCFVDVCVEGRQFCDKLQRRCKYCSDVGQDCFTNLQQQNCTQYCMEKWVDLQEQSHGQVDRVEFTTTALVGWILLILLIISIIAVYLVDKRCFQHKLLDTLKRVTCCCEGVANNTSPRPVNGYDPVSIEDVDRGEGEGDAHPQDGDGNDRRASRGQGAIPNGVGVSISNSSRSSDSSRQAPEANITTELASVYANDNRRNIDRLHDGSETKQNVEEPRRDESNNRDGNNINGPQSTYPRESAQNMDPVLDYHHKHDKNNDINEPSCPERGQERQHTVRPNCGVGRTLINTTVRPNNAHSNMQPLKQMPNRFDNMNGQIDNESHVGHACSSARPELGSRACSLVCDGEDAMPYRNPVGDTGYGSSPNDLDHTHRKIASGDDSNQQNVEHGAGRRGPALMPAMDSNRTVEENKEYTEADTLSLGEFHSDVSKMSNQTDGRRDELGED